MLSKCANPACGVPFNHFNQGRLFEFEFNPRTKEVVCERGPRKPNHTIVLYWLCGKCAKTMTLECTDAGEIAAIPQRHVKKRIGGMTA
jgi:hypothetical protein